MKNSTIFIATVFVLAFGFSQVHAQNVAINATGVAPANCAMLDISATNMGLLIPRVVLTNVAVYAPLVGAPVDGMIVYSTAAPIGGNGTGFYYWSTTAALWVNLTDNLAPGAPWYLNGNTLTGTEFIGSLNAQPWIVKTNNVERMRVDPNGLVGIGILAPTSQLHVVNTAATGVAVTGSMPNVTGHLGYVANIPLGAFGSVPGAGVFAADPTSNNYPSLVSISTGAANYSSLISYSNIWIGGFFGVDNASAIYNPPGLYGQLNVTGTVGGYQAGAEGYLNRTAAGNPGYSAGVMGIAASNAQDGFGVYGQYSGTGTGFRDGGYFTANANFAYVADNVNNRKITGSGGVSEVIPTPDHGRIMLTCPESPEYWYQDYGTVQLVNGMAHVTLDPILADIIVVDSSNPLKVFVQVNMTNCNGVAVINKTATGFDLVEVNGGTHSGEVDYQIIARPKTNYGEGRFPQGPGPAGSPKEIPTAAKAQNSGHRDNMFRWPADQTVYGYVLTQPLPVTPAPPKR